MKKKNPKEPAANYYKGIMPIKDRAETTTGYDVGQPQESHNDAKGRIRWYIDEKGDDPIEEFECPHRQTSPVLLPVTSEGNAFILR
jgi:hypothetical protein